MLVGASEDESRRENPAAVCATAGSSCWILSSPGRLAVTLPGPQGGFNGGRARRAVRDSRAEARYADCADADDALTDVGGVPRSPHRGACGQRARTGSRRTAARSRSPPTETAARARPGSRRGWQSRSRDARLARALVEPVVHQTYVGALYVRLVGRGGAPQQPSLLA